MFAMFVLFMLCSYLIYLSIQYLRGFWPIVRMFGLYPPKTMKGKMSEEKTIILGFIAFSFLTRVYGFPLHTLKSPNKANIRTYLLTVLHNPRQH